MYFGEVNREAAILTSGSVVSPKTWNLKTQSENRWALQEGEKDVWVCVGKGEVKDLEYIPTGIGLKDKPVWLSALQQSQGVALERRGQISTFPTASSHSYQPALVCLHSFK